jgi:hypothetical protein
MTERAYYNQQTSAGAPILALGTFVSIIMAVGSCFAAMNTMYAAVSRRLPTGTASSASPLRFSPAS